MNNPSLTPLENEMLNFDFAAFKEHANTAKSAIATTESVADIKAQICSVWSKIGKFVKLAANIPVIGKYISILADLLDSICAA